jgi:hypothetical protein
MSKPVYAGVSLPDQAADAATAAAANGLPMIDGRQAVALASITRPDGTARHWYKLDDDREIVHDAAGNPAAWWAE